MIPDVGRPEEGISVKLQRYAVVTGAGLMAVTSLTACSSTKSTPTAGGSTTTTTAVAPATTTSSAPAIACGTGTLALSGSTAQQNAIAQWIKEYQTACPGSTITYNGDGSGAGVTDFTNKTSDFAGSDSPLTAAQQTPANARCGGGTAIDIPTTPGAIAFLYHLSGVTNALNLSASTLAKIFDGAITVWNDPAIVKDNPGVTLPATKISVFFRSDSSGTSKNTSAYLNGEDAADFSQAPNSQWPGKAGQGAAKSAGVVAGITATDGGIGYAELSYATASNVTAANIGNAGGAFVAPSATNATNFIAKAKVTTNGSDTRLAFDYTDQGATDYPAPLITYEVVCASGNDASKLPLIKGFLSYITGAKAQGELTNLGYVPLPDAIQTSDATVISSLS
jgi:phosphate transport system substrate-binding protein